MEQVSLMMAGAQLGITVCSLGLGAIGEPAVAHLLEPVFDGRCGVPEAAVYPISFVIALSVVVALHVVIGEMVPKNLALAGPDRAALVLAPPLKVVVTVLKPFLLVMNAVGQRASCGWSASSPRTRSPAPSPATRSPDCSTSPGPVACSTPPTTTCSPVR